MMQPAFSSAGSGTLRSNSSKPRTHLGVCHRCTPTCQTYATLRWQSNPTDAVTVPCTGTYSPGQLTTAPMTIQQNGSAQIMLMCQTPHLWCATSGTPLRA